MATTIYERFRFELIFYKDGLKDSEGHPIMNLAGFCFVEVAQDKKFIMPLPTNIRISNMQGAGCGLAKTDIVNIHILERRTAIPQVQGSAKVGCQFFGDV